MEGEEESKPKLPLNKVLELLIPKVQPGHTIPDPLVTPPWRLPSSTSENAAKINSILNKSMEIQSSKIPDSDDFENFIISNSCLAIAGLLKYYLQSLNFAPNAKVMFGVLLWDANARDGPDDFEGTPHVWLDINDCPIDNTHVALPPEASEMHLEYFYKAKKANYYLKTDPITTHLKLYLGSDESLNTTRHNLKVFRTFITNDNDDQKLIEKYLVFALECIGLNPSVKMYDLCMRKYLKEQFQIEVQDLVEKWSKICWTCCRAEDESEEMLKCSCCKLAKYCGKQCQKSDWKSHKLLRKEMELTAQVLEQMKAEEEGN